MMFVSFAAFGAVCSFVYSFVTFVENLLKIRILTFASDIIMMLSFAVAFFCFVVGYGENGFRFYHFFVSLLGFLAYRFTVHKLFYGFERKISNKLSVKRNSFTKRLKKF